MPKTAVINASPLIFLSRAGQINLLAKFYSAVIVPSCVLNEIFARGEDDPTVVAVKKAPWIQVDDSNIVDDLVAAWVLGAGESSVISLASRKPDCEVIIDDMLGRRCALSMGLFVRGTLGIVLLAKKHGYIASAKSVMEDLIRGGMYLDERTLKAALLKVGE